MSVSGAERTTGAELRTNVRQSGNSEARRILMYLGHPAHYHNVKVAAERLASSGHRILLIARQKDVLFDLLRGCPHDVRFMAARTKRGTTGLFLHVAVREVRMLSWAAAFRPDVLVGTDIVITHVARMLGRCSLILNEDDAAEVPLLARYGFPHATALLAPECCDLAPYNAKKIGYRGYQELAYLHPKYFRPDRQRIRHLAAEGERFFMLRFSALSAHHDVGRSGIDAALARRLVDLLTPHGAVYITSERPLEPQFERYRVPIDPADMHHALAFADMYIGDSQTMAAEAAVLGTPSLRFNDFVGKLSYLEELERVYGLTIGIPTSQPERLLGETGRLLADSSTRAEWQRRRGRMLQETVDVADFFTEQILEYAERSRRRSGRG